MDSQCGDKGTDPTSEWIGMYNVIYLQGPYGLVFMITQIYVNVMLEK